MGSDGSRVRPRKGGVTKSHILLYLQIHFVCNCYILIVIRCFFLSMLYFIVSILLLVYFVPFNNNRMIHCIVDITYVVF